MDLETQLLEYKHHLPAFYRQKKIHMVTEDELMKGLHQIESQDELI
jgi:hypothetical protein